MGFEVSLDAFEGPIELLLHLIKTKKLDITRIAIAEIIDDYLALMQGITIDIDQAGEFLQVATLLLKYKVRCLLPVEQAEDETVEGVDHLVQLMQNKYYAVIADLLDTWQVEREGYYGGGMRPFLVEQAEKVEDALQDVTLLKLAIVFDHLQKNATEEQIKQTSLTVKDLTVTLAEQKQWLLEVYAQQRVYLGRVISNFSDKLKQVITFLAVLECIQEGLIAIISQELNDPLLFFTV